MSDPPGVAGGVYTRVEWSLGDIAPGQTVQVRYAAGIPIHENTLDFGGPTPTPGSGAQAANLDNNTGPSTRETTSEQALTNTAEVTGTYTGDVADGNPQAVTSSAQATVTAEDVANDQVGHADDLQQR